MLVLPKEAENLFIESLSKDFGKSPTKELMLEFSKLARKVFREAEEEQDIDIQSLKDRLKWYLGKLVTNKESLEQWQQSKLYQELFKDVVITAEENGINVTVKGQQVSGNTKGLLLVYVIYTYLFTVSFTSIGEQADEIGGALLKKASFNFLAEAAKRADLSDYPVSGEPLRLIGESVADKYPLSNLLASAVCILLLDKKFSSVHKELVLISINIVKTMISNAVGYIYTLIVKLGELYNINTKFLAKDIVEQFKAIGIVPEENTEE